MAGARNNEKWILDFIQARGGRVKLGDIVDHFFNNATSSHYISKEGIYGALKRLEEKKLIIRIELKKGDAKRVFFEVPSTDLEFNVEKFIEDYKGKHNRNPTLEEIAINVGKPPEEIKSAVYLLAKKLEWYNPEQSIASAAYLFGGTADTKLDRKEIKFVIEKVKNPETSNVASKYLNSISYKQDLIKYPSFLTIISEILENATEDEMVQDLLYAISVTISSATFKKNFTSTKIQREIKKLSDTLFKIVNNDKLKKNVREYSLQLLGGLNDNRVIELLIESLNNFDEKTMSYDFKNTFDSWILHKFYSEHHEELLSKLFELKNKKGAEILIGLMNRYEVR